jgi:ubiquinone/menaquinone biosynthesis C-methylase UbiE
MREDSSTRSWNSIADDWVAHADTNDYRNLFLMPLTLRMLGDVRGLRIIDVGCGEGGYARELARRGAHVTGVDGSERLISVARQRTIDGGIQVRYVCANASALTDCGLEPESFNLALAAMSLMDVEDYPRAIGEVHRALVSGGELLMSITHPCFTAPVSEWKRDERGQPQVFNVDRYLERIAWNDPITGHFRSPVLRRHRPLEDYLNAAIKAGLVLREFREPCPTEEDLQKSRRFAKITRIPYFLFLKWAKP